MGLDVDDTQYHGSAFDQPTGAVIDFQCRSTLKGLLRQLENLGQHMQDFPSDPFLSNRCPLLFLCLNVRQPHCRQYGDDKANLVWE